MEEPAELSGAGSRYKQPIPQEEDGEAAVQLLRPTGGNEQSGNSRTTVIRPAAELGGSKSQLKKRRPIREILVIPCTVLLLGIVLMGVFLVLMLHGQHEKPRLADGLIETEVDCGVVQGYVEDGAFAFRGIPYALPPIGDLRWQKTVPLNKMEDCWQGTLYAHSNGPHCYQQPPDRNLINMDEDCLYLDVYTPDVTFRDPKPVVVYFSGNSLLGDDKYSIRLKPSARLAREQQMVFVSVNYRLGPFGFLALKTFHNKHSSTSGNYGLYDMIAALQWIQMNIESFGGNTRTVTLLGYGSGATAILGLVMSPLAKGLFNQVWITGGSADFVNVTLEEAEKADRVFLKNIECKNFHCLTHKKPEKILEAVSLDNSVWGIQNFTDLPIEGENSAAILVVDGEIIPNLPSKTLRKNQFNDVSLVIGAPAHQLETLSRLQHLTWDDILNHITDRLGNISETVLEEAKERYFLHHDEANPLQFARMVSEVRVLCPLFQLARRAGRHFTNKVYAYTMSYIPGDKKFDGSAHLLDIAAILDQLDLILDNVTSEDRAFGQSMRRLFYHFVKTTKFGDIVQTRPKQVYTYLDVAGQRIFPSYRSHHPHCDLWLRNDFYPRYARQN